MAEAYAQGCKDTAVAFQRFKQNDLVLQSMGKYVALVDMGRRRNEAPSFVSAPAADSVTLAAARGTAGAAGAVAAPGGAAGDTATADADAAAGAVAGAAAAAGAVAAIATGVIDAVRRCAAGPGSRQALSSSLAFSGKCSGPWCTRGKCRAGLC